MSFRNTHLLSAFVLGAAALAASVMGCEVIASVDRSMIPQGAGGSGSTTATSSTASATSSSSSGAGGATCMAASDCMDTAMDCLTPTCDMGVCGTKPEAKGTACAVDNGVVCDDMGKCVAASCMDGLMNGDETDVDCGGSCSACADGKKCGMSADCIDKVCTGMVCQAPTCMDMQANGDETDVDCGGSCAPMQKCDDGKGCGVAGDCKSDVCTAKVCQVPACDDGVMNGDETDVDCGGSCVADPTKKCATGLKCSTGPDCKSGVCMGGICQPSCTDGAKNQDETDVDCGGTICSKCTPGKDCMAPTDCNSGVCTMNKCQSATCMDGVQNQGESDIDCGGLNCAACGPGKKCTMNSDCTSNTCKPNMTCM